MKLSKKFDIVVNRQAGTVLREGEVEVSRNLHEALGEQLANIKFVDAADLSDAVQKWSVTHVNSDHTLIVGGGDGSLLTAASEILASGRDIELGMLPLGTQNGMVRKMGFSEDYKKAAAQYKNVSSRKIDVGQVNGMYFLIGLILDPNAVRIYEGREDLRKNRRISALRNIFSSVADVLFGEKMAISVSSKGPDRKKRTYHGKIFSVTTNPFSPRSNKGIFPHPGNIKTILENFMSREKKGEGKLGFYVFEGGTVNTAGILPGLWNGTWDRHKSITSQTAQEFVINPVAPNPGQKKTTLILDGEIKQTQYPLKVGILPKALRLCQPAP
jgi:diacylglycerol kinase family enzyme